MFADIGKFHRPARREGMFGWLRHAFALSRERRHLAQLDAAALKDLGLTRADVAGELAQPFWMRPDFGAASQSRRPDALLKTLNCR